MTSATVPPGRTEPGELLAAALAEVAALAPALDNEPRFPSESFAALLRAGVPQIAADRSRCTLEREIALVRATAAADASTARILDGHFNGVERLAMLAPGELRERDLAAVGEGRLLVGVWGADPVDEEGEPAHLERRGEELVLRGVKTFCSGAGGVQRAVVVAREQDGGRRAAYIDATAGLEIDRGWYRASGLRSSESHRVEFHDAPVLALLGGPGELGREPWFSRDALRTTATWAGLADCIVRAALDALRPIPLDDLRLHALGRMRLALGTIDVWLAHACASVERPAPELAATIAQARLAVAEACRTISSEAARTCGSRALVGASDLDRARRDLDLFLLQHRLDPKLLELGRGSFEEYGR